MDILYYPLALISKLTQKFGIECWEFEHFERSIKILVVGIGNIVPLKFLQRDGLIFVNI